MDPFLQVPVPVPPLEAEQLHVWRLDLAPPTESLAGMSELLSAEEREKAARFRFERDRVRYVAAHGGMRLILAAYVNAAPDRLEFSTNAHGKPALEVCAAGGLPASVAPGFNLSHAGSWGLLAVGRRRFIGADIERQRDLPDLARLAESVLSPAELTVLQATELDRRAECFFQMWARKEAVVKAIGRGLGAGLREIEIDPADPAASPSFRVISGLVHSPPLFGLCFRPFDEYYAAVVCEDSLPPIVWQEWPTGENLQAGKQGLP
jgi:4'-phosphopantetheinyl transferase